MASTAEHFAVNVLARDFRTLRHDAIPPAAGAIAPFMPRADVQPVQRLSVLPMSRNR
jgi:hypothetical protein